MSGTDEHPSPQGSRRVLILSTVVVAASAAAVLALGTHDARLLRLGLVAALWAALLGAFATARLRREISSCAEHADLLRTVYQLELEREVAARREHTLTVERELREQVELSQRREIGELRTELAAMRANLERLLAGNPLVERPESTRALPPPVHPRKFDDGRGRATPATTTVAAVTAMPSLTGPECRFGPMRLTPASGVASSPANGVILNGTGRHDASGREWPGSNGNGSRNNGGGARWAPEETPTAAPGAQRTVNDLLAANGRGSVARRRRSHDDGPAASGEGVSRSS